MKNLEIIEKAKKSGFGILETKTKYKILCGDIMTPNKLKNFLNSIGIYPTKKELNFGFVYVIPKK